MNTHADQTQENKRQSVSAADSRTRSGGESIFQFVDNRPEAVAQRKLQEMANNSPRVRQLRSLQERAISNSDSPIQRVEASEMPSYLYHASPEGVAPLIARGSLLPLSVGGEDFKYLCMSAEENGATTKSPQASDIVFRVAGASLNPADWWKGGAGKAEWRSKGSILGGILEYRRYLSTKTKDLQWKTINKMESYTNRKGELKIKW